MEEYSNMFSQTYDKAVVKIYGSFYKYAIWLGLKEDEAIEIQLNYEIRNKKIEGVCK
jgi:hypothetical protein